MLSHFTTDKPASDFPDVQPFLIVAPANVQDGWVYDGTFHAYVPTAEELRLAAIDTAIQTDATLESLKAMSNAQFDTWWTANVSTNAQAIAFMKRLARVVIRRLL